jgi:TPP-dependent pyruvate/acetoin dehydrogenase alpha subunit
MHLFSPAPLAARSGVVGASAPAAVGFGLAAQRLRPATVCIVFFGEGAMNQGMLVEALNLATVWRLSVLFVCKHTGLTITTISNQVTGGTHSERPRALGMPAREIDGSDAMVSPRTLPLCRHCTEKSDRQMPASIPRSLFDQCNAPHQCAQSQNPLAPESC